MNFIALQDSNQQVLVNLDAVTSIEIKEINSFGDKKVLIYTNDRTKPLSVALSARMYKSVFKYLVEKTNCGSVCKTERSVFSQG